MTAVANWTDDLNDREKKILSHAVHYAGYYADAGIPGSNHILLIAKLAEKLDAAEKKVNPEEPWSTEEPERKRLSDYIRHSDDVIRKPFSPNRDA